MYQTKQQNRIGIYEKALPNEISWQDKLREAGKLKFDFIEISIDESEQRRARLDWSDDEIYHLRRLCEQYQIPLHSMCLSAHRKYPFGSSDANIRHQAEVIMDKAITLAYKLGIRLFNWLVMMSIMKGQICRLMSALLRGCSGLLSKQKKQESCSQLKLWIHLILMH